MSEIVTIYKINCFAALDPSQEGVSCSLLPWMDGPDCRGEDDGGRDYILPEHYGRGATPEGMPAVLSEDGRACSLMLHNDVPLLIDAEKRRAWLLEPVKKLATQRELAGLTREELAGRLGVTQQELYRWENLEAEPDAGTLERIASILGCEISDFR